MREIKFRAWDKQFKRFSDKALNHTIADINFHTDYEWIQYTGSKDINDVEIYLGDIVKREFEVYSTYWEGSIETNDLAPTQEIADAGYFIGVVSQTPQGLYVLNKCSKYDVDGNFIRKRSGVKLFAHRAEVIGNIYENPELLVGDSNGI